MKIVPVNGNWKCCGKFLVDWYDNVFGMVWEDLRDCKAVFIPSDTHCTSGNPFSSATMKPATVLLWKRKF